MALASTLFLGALPMAVQAKKPDVQLPKANIPKVVKGPDGQKEDGQSQTSLPSDVPHMIPMTQDGNPPLVAPDVSRNLDIAETAADLGAQYGRVVVYPRDILRKHPRWQIYDNQVNAFKLMGRNVYMTLSGRGVGMDEKRFAEFVTDVAVHERDSHQGVDWYGMKNEPNSPGEMQKLQGYTEAESYHIYYEIGRRALKKILPYAKTDFGELNGWLMKGGEPAQKFFRRAVVCPHDRPHCPPLYADGYAHHPYNFTLDPRSSSNTGNGVLGVNNLVTIHKMLDWAAKNNHLKYTGTSTGGDMPIDFTEWTILVLAPEVKQNSQLDQQSPRYKLDHTRMNWFRGGLNRMCDDPRVRMVNIYQPLPPPPGWPGPFHAQIVYKSGKKYPSYYVIKKTFTQRADCIEPPAAPSATGGVSSVRTTLLGAG